METTTPNAPEKEHFFHKPTFMDRIKSMTIDSFVIIFLMFLFSNLLDSLGVESGQIRGFFLLLVILYEPIMVAINRTLGQKIMGLRVRNYSTLKDRNSKQNINVFASLLRFAIKLLLGWISLLTIHSDKYGRAIHDNVANSVMTNEP